MLGFEPRVVVRRGIHIAHSATALLPIIHLILKSKILFKILLSLISLKKNSGDLTFNSAPVGKFEGHRFVSLPSSIFFSDQ